MKWWARQFKYLSDLIKSPRLPWSRLISQIKTLEYTQSQKKELPSINDLQNIFFTGKNIKEMWVNYTHRELKTIFELGSSPNLSNHITSLKKLASRSHPHHALVAATLLLMSFKGRGSEVICQYLDVVLKDLDSEAPRASVTLIAPGQVAEIQLALTQITDEQLRNRCPESYEVMTSTLHNALSDIGRTLMRSPNGIQFPPFRTFHDLSQKIARRWHLLYAPFFKYPTNEFLVPYENLSFQGQEIKIIANSKELFSYGVELENCLYTYSDVLKRKEKNFFLLAKDGKVKWVCEIDVHRKIVEIKGAYNTEAPLSLKQDLQLFIYTNQGRK